MSYLKQKCKPFKVLSFLFCLLLCASISNKANSQTLGGTVLISEISLCDQAIELQNVGNTNVDVSSWYLCNFPAYDQIFSANVQIISGSTALAPGDFVTIKWSGMGQGSGELGLYEIPLFNISLFNDPNAIRDYVQYNSNNNQKAPVAVAADVWDNVQLGIIADPNLNCISSIANGQIPSVTNSTTWCLSQTNTYFPTGTNSGCQPTPSCGITALDAANFICVTSTAGVDMVTVNVDYLGFDPNAILSITINGVPTSPTTGTNYQSGPGTISFPAMEGDTYVVTFIDPLCSLLVEMGTIPTNQCPAPAVCGITFLGNPVYTCQTSTAGVDPVKVDVDYGGFDPDAMLSITVNGIPLPPGSIGGNDPTMPPSNGTISFLAMEGDVIAVTFTDLLCSGLSVGGAIPTNQCPAPAVCGITFLGNPVYTCQTSTAGVDPVKVDVDYGGFDSDAMLSITVNGILLPPGSIGGNDPTMPPSNGTISFPAMEGDVIVVMFTDPLCSGLSAGGTIPTNQCPAPSACGITFLGNPVYTCQTSTAGIDPVGVAINYGGVDNDAILSISVNGFQVPNFGDDPQIVTGGTIFFPALEGDDIIVTFIDPICSGLIVDTTIPANQCPGLSLCGITFLSNPNYTCQAFTAGVDLIKVDINYGGVDPSAMLSITVNGIAVPNFGDNPQIVSGGTITFPAMEGDVIIVTFNDIACMGLLINTTIPATQCPCPDDYANGGLPNSQPSLTGLQDFIADYEADGDIISDQVIGSINPNIAVDYDSGTSILLLSGFEVFSEVTFHAFIDGCGGI